jgi:hypothetical protein
MESIQIDIERAKLDPAHEFKRPKDVLENDSISRTDKIDILRRWAYDEREIAVAEEENMQGIDADTNNTLDEILECLLKLKIDNDQTVSAPTKQG